MRIIGGQFKGRKINPPKNLNARPTTDFAKEALFNILQNQTETEGARVLDLFSGSGGIAFEFASRGAGSVTTVDLNFNHIKAIKFQAREWELKNFSAIKSDVFKYLGKADGEFDIVFADPPYAFKDIEHLPDAILKANVLADAGILIVEHGKDTDYSQHPNFDKTKVYSSVNFSFFKQNKS
jgi:16S rRNA (guanine(966)-N(2))-methyltransferase RsmD